MIYSIEIEHSLPTEIEMCEAIVENYSQIVKN